MDCGGRERERKPRVVGGLALYDTNVGDWTLNPDQKRIDRENRDINYRLAKARKGGRYPGPKEAAETMKVIEKLRSRVTRERLEEEELALRVIEKQNRMMLEAVARAIKGGRIDNRWSDDFWRRNVVEVSRRKRIDHLIAQRCLAAENVKICLRLLKEIHSEYSRSATQRDWKHMVHQMRCRSRFAVSDWWCEYLTELASMPPKRRCPPQTVKEQLDKITEMAHEEMQENLAFHLTKDNAYLNT